MKPRLLDLFCGAGGAAMGYHRAGFEVVGVDIKPQPHYPFEFHQADALTYPLEGFDAYHASPPCQEHSASAKSHQRINPVPYHKLDRISETRNLFLATGKPFVIENVPNAPLINPLKLSGTMFGLKVIRRRLFELHGFEIWFAPKPYTLNSEVKSGKYSCIVGGGDAGTNINLDKWKADIGIDWMSKPELCQAIPPAYTEYIGKYLMQAVLSGD